MTTLYKADGTTPLTFTHMVGDFTKGIDGGGPYYECTFLFDDWGDSDTVPNQMLGVTRYSGTPGSGVTTRVLPMTHPLSPNLYCRSAVVSGIGRPFINANGYPAYWAGFTVKAEFRAAQQGQADTGLQQIVPTSPVIWCTQELDWESQWITIPNTSLKFGSDGKKTGFKLEKEVTVTTMRLTFHRLPYMPVPQFRALRGRTNNGNFLGATTVDTVKFMGGTTVREASTDGSIVQTCTLTFKERDIPWGSGIRPDTLAIDTILTPSGGPTSVQADLSPLIRL